MWTKFVIVILFKWS